MNAKYLCILAPMLLAGCQPTDQSPPQSQRTAVAVTAPDPQEMMDFRKVTDIDQRLNGAKDKGIEELAQAIADVDEWLYGPEDEKPARERIESAIGKLRTKIEAEVGSLTKLAIEAPNGKVATEKLSKINPLLSLYPAPKTDEQRARLDKMASGVLSASKRVEDIRRLRYNDWAITRIQQGLEEYRRAVEFKGIADAKKVLSTNKEALIDVCVRYMAEIDTAFLEPATMDLYSYVYGLTRDQIGSDDQHRIKLARRFADFHIKRITPSEF
jgi:hypothetical protein